MKTGMILVLVIFSTLGMEMACAKRLPSRKQRPGVCPKVEKGVSGICLNGCSGDESCPRRMKSCSNGRGQVCETPPS
uniref:WAP domain-containing protein n=1 Tax=Loxodonta africana TaxID=9785 RepID=G3U7R5_LOXAF